MTDNIKGIANAIFRVNPAPKEISLEEMLQYRAKSKEMLQNRIRSGTKKQSGGKENSTVETGNLCPKCGVANWNQFPDGREYCCGCGAIIEIDGTVTGGAIQKKIQITGNKIMGNIICEFTCDKCPEVIKAKGKDIETARKKVVPHKDYDQSSNCDGVFTFSRQVSAEVQITSIPKTKEPEKRSIEPETVIYENEKCHNPKRDIFVCNRCPDFNYCDQTYNDAIVCLLISIDMKLKKLVGRSH